MSFSESDSTPYIIIATVWRRQLMLGTRSPAKSARRHRFVRSCPWVVRTHSYHMFVNCVCMCLSWAPPSVGLPLQVHSSPVAVLQKVRQLSASIQTKPGAMLKSTHIEVACELDRIARARRRRAPTGSDCRSLLTAREQKCLEDCAPPNVSLVVLLCTGCPQCVQQQTVYLYCVHCLM